ncbi:DUF1090 family protein [Caballeronia ptereochthonis]
MALHEALNANCTDETLKSENQREVTAAQQKLAEREREEDRRASAQGR